MGVGMGEARGVGRGVGTSRMGDRLRQPALGTSNMMTAPQVLRCWHADSGSRTVTCISTAVT